MNSQSQNGRLKRTVTAGLSVGAHALNGLWLVLQTCARRPKAAAAIIGPSALALVFVNAMSKPQTSDTAESAAVTVDPQIDNDEMPQDTANPIRTVSAESEHLRPVVPRGAWLTGGIEEVDTAPRTYIRQASFEQ